MVAAMLGFAPFLPHRYFAGPRQPAAHRLTCSTTGPSEINRVDGSLPIGP